MTLAKVHQEYEQIMEHAPGPDRDRALAQLMDRIKCEFGVPLMHNPEWEARNRPVIALYRKVSESRTTI